MTRMRWIALAIAGVVLLGLGIAAGILVSDTHDTAPAAVHIDQSITPKPIELQYTSDWSYIVDAAERCYTQHKGDPAGPQVVRIDGPGTAVRIKSAEGSVEILELTNGSTEVYLEQTGEPRQALKPAEPGDKLLGWTLPANEAQADAWELQFLLDAQRWLAASAGSTTLDPGTCAGDDRITWRGSCKPSSELRQ